MLAMVVCFLLGLYLGRSPLHKAPVGTTPVAGNAGGGGGGAAGGRGPRAASGGGGVGGTPGPSYGGPGATASGNGGPPGAGGDDGDLGGPGNGRRRPPGPDSPVNCDGSSDPGAQAQGDLLRLAQGKSLTRYAPDVDAPGTLTPQREDSNTPAVSAPSSAAPADPLRISLFSPPARSQVKTGIMIVQHVDKPVAALLQAKIAPPT